MANHPKKGGFNAPPLLGRGEPSAAAGGVEAGLENSIFTPQLDDVLVLQRVGAEPRLWPCQREQIAFDVRDEVAGGAAR